MPKNNIDYRDYQEEIAHIPQLDKYRKNKDKFYKSGTVGSWILEIEEAVNNQENIEIVDTANKRVYLFVSVDTSKGSIYFIDPTGPPAQPITLTDLTAQTLNINAIMVITNETTDNDYLVEKTNLFSGNNHLEFSCVEGKKS